MTFDQTGGLIGTLTIAQASAGLASPEACSQTRTTKVRVSHRLRFRGGTMKRTTLLLPGVNRSPSLSGAGLIEMTGGSVTSPHPPGLGWSAANTRTSAEPEYFRCR